MIKKKLTSDSGAANTVELIMIFLFLFVILITIIDFGLYFSNRNIVVNSAQNGARLAAIYGGASNTNIAKAYGRTAVDSDCATVGANNPVSCSIYKDLKESKGLTNTSVSKVECGPNITNKIGDRTYCEIVWAYKGVLGDNASLANKVFSNQVTRMTAESEVVHK